VSRPWRRPEIGLRAWAAVGLDEADRLGAGGPIANVSWVENLRGGLHGSDENGERVSQEVVDSAVLNGASPLFVAHPSHLGADFDLAWQRRLSPEGGHLFKWVRRIPSAIR
jgi:hypothetical protein